MEAFSLKKLATILLGVIIWNTSFAQKPIVDHLVEIPHKKTDTIRIPEESERQRIPLGVPSVRKTEEGQKAILQKIDGPTRLHPVNEILTLQGCEGKSLSKEEAMRNGNVCAHSAS